MMIFSTWTGWFESMGASDWAAWYAAVVGSIALWLEVSKRRAERPILKASAKFSNPDGGQRVYAVIDVRNTGKESTLIEHILI
jgi:hypothetical protein